MIYLLHFDRPYKHARHYLGTTKNLDQRLTDHVEGRGSRLMQVVSEAGIGFSVARVWPNGGRTLERKLKNLKNTPRLCPFCMEN